MRIAALIVFCAMATSLSSSAQQAEEAEKVARQLLEAISTRDTTMFRDALAPGAQVIGLRSEKGVAKYRIRGVEENVKSLGNDGPAMLERMWEPEIRIDGPLASVWTRYDFYVDGEFSHCGTDAFHIVNTADGWKITAIIYTIEPDTSKCPESPLGAPEN